MIRYFEPQPAAAELPAVMPSPFAQGAPHPLAARAMADVVAGLGPWRAELDARGGGKMFGVAVVRDRDGRIGYLRAFSGMLGGTWDVPGFAPAAFDAAIRERVWPTGEVELAALAAQIAELATGPRTLALRAELAAITRAHDAATAAITARHAAQRAERHTVRAAHPDPGALLALAQASRADTAERRRHDAEQATARAPTAAAVAAIDDARRALEATRAARSQALLLAIYDSYVLANARGERRPMRALFAPEQPPGGAGDCAAPKLLAAAYRLGVTPLALAERWVGAPPLTGGRLDGMWYPACRGKCGVILPFMLDGLAVEPAPVFGRAPIAADEPRVVFEDDQLVVVAKPAGLLSVPGRSGALRDSVQTRLRARYPAAPELAVVHRLDLDTSGVLVAAKTSAARTAIQRQLARGEAAKRYIAWLDGELPSARDAGTIELALRVDVDDRPRQIVDPVHGKLAVTDWRVVARAQGRTRMELAPRTGRTHQLRVHAAHPAGLGLPIVGDALYGRGGDRLMLHAEAIAFVHPLTGTRVAFEVPSPF